MTGESSAWDAYVGAVIRIEAPGGIFWLRPAPAGRTQGEYPDPGQRPIYILTAHNPDGRVVSDAENAAAEARLTAELGRRGLTWWPADGGDPSWSHVEPGAALFDLAEPDVIALAAEYGQEAIFVLTPADRRIVGCVSHRVSVTGWATDREAG
jgi:Protein of unknown function (DUF3293)